MKRFFIATLVAIFVLFAVAAKAQFRFALRGGAGAAWMSFQQRNSPAFSFHAGVFGLYQIPVTLGNFEVEVGLQLEKLGGVRHDAGVSGVVHDVAYHLFYVQTPLRANMLFYAGPVSILLGAGPKIGFFTNGSRDFIYRDSGTKEYKSGVDLNANNVARVDVAASVVAGVRFASVPVQITLYTDFGLLPVTKNAYTGRALKNSISAGISLAYVFGASR